MSRSGRGDNRSTKSGDYKDAMKVFQEKLEAQIKANADAAAATAMATTQATTTSTEQVQSTSAATQATATATAMASQSSQSGSDNSGSGRRGRDDDDDRGRDRDRDRDRDDDRSSDDSRTSQGGTAGDDALVAGRREDKLGGGEGNDTLIDAGGQRNAKTDKFLGGSGNDAIYTHWGSDRAKGGAGDDIIVSRSDAGEPVPQRGGSRQTSDDFRPRDTNDKLTGGTGKDAFQFRLDLSAIPSILATNLLDHDADEHGGPGVIDWEGVTGENGDGGNPSHLHWVEGFGTDTITDFNRAEGDTIEVYGHTADVLSIEVKNGSSYVTIRSDQGGNGGTHNGDILGVIIVKGVTDITEADITVHAEPHLGSFESITDMPPARRGDDDDDAAESSWGGTPTDGDDVLVASKKSDSLNGGAGNDILVDAGGTKVKASEDSFTGGAGDDQIFLHRGADKADGGDGADVIVSRSDGGEPKSAETGATFYRGQPLDGKYSDDTLTGGGGADTFQFRFDINAKYEILAKHIEDHGENHDHGGPGVIDWEGVTGENNADHDHWVESIGRDTITDFVSGTDKIELYGHTVNIDDGDITTIDTNGDGTVDSTQIRVTSEQGDAGAHDEDLLGYIVLKDVLNFNVTNDLVIHAEVHLGAFGSIDDIIVA